MTQKIRIVDVTEIGDPQVLAMLQAFYSRSPMPIDQRLESLLNDADGETAATKIKNAIQRYYVDYGHASIGECGGTTVFIEGVSMLAAKAVQDHPLYVGQECSTRYIDFAHQPFLAHGTVDQALAEDWRKLYQKALPLAVTYARDVFSPEKVVSAKIQGDQIQAAFARTCNAIAFDYCRALLPAGATTSLAWTANFRVFSDHLNHLASHPLEEVRTLAAKLYDALRARYPSSFKQVSLADRIPGAAEVYYNLTIERAEPEVFSTWIPDEGDLSRSLLKSEVVPYHKHDSDNAAYFGIHGDLDFGSYRDLQRHRNGHNKMPWLSASRKFSDYHMTAFVEMDPTNELADSVMELLHRVKVTKSIGDAGMTRQYVCPMGLNVPTKLHWSLGQLRYGLALRTKTSVHPTLRSYMHDVYNSVPKCEFGSNLVKEYLIRSLKVDTSEDYEASDRGEQTIKEKPNDSNGS